MNDFEASISESFTELREEKDLLFVMTAKYKPTKLFERMFAILQENTSTKPSSPPLDIHQGCGVQGNRKYSQFHVHRKSQPGTRLTELIS